MILNFALFFNSKKKYRHKFSKIHQANQAARL